MEITFAGYISELRRDFTEFCDKELSKDNITVGLLYPILYINNHEGCTPKQVANAIDMDTGYLTRILKKLEQLNMITRQSNDEDKRSIRLFITDNGKKIFAKSHQLFKQWDEITLNRLTKDETEQLMNIMKRIKESR